MHFKEYGRASNTGKLFLIGQPRTASLYIFGLPEDEARLAHDLAQGPSLVLYPSPEARPISEYRHLLTSSDKPMRLCVVDSTWMQSRTMINHIPDHIPRVRIDDLVTGPSQFLNRKQSTNKSKVSTIEAVIMAMRGLGVNEEEITQHSRALEYSVDAVLQQAGKKAVYGNRVTPQFEQSKRCSDSDVPVMGRFTKPKVSKPSVCLHCHTAIGDTNFKNLGVRKRKVVPATEGEASEEVGDEVYKTLVDRDFEALEQANASVAIAIKAIISKDSYRVWRCSTCNRCFPAEN